MNFLESICARLERDSSAPVLREIRDGQFVSATGTELLSLISAARGFVRSRNLHAQDRCAVIAPNSIQWVALDLALLLERMIVVPLYARDAAATLANKIRDCSPAAIFYSDAMLAKDLGERHGIAAEWIRLDAVFAGGASAGSEIRPVAATLDESATVKIIYTSGSSGEPKGVLLTAGNFTHILRCTNKRLDQLMTNTDRKSGATRERPDQIFHYGPFGFAASTVLLYTALSRRSVLTLSTDLGKLAEEIKVSEPDYFLNVPALLERVRARVSDTIAKRGGALAAISARAQRAWLRRHGIFAKGSDSGVLPRKGSTFIDRVCFALARLAIFPSIRTSIGRNLKALICGSAPLHPETQLFFMMLGIRVLQVYGLTETTAICTMDDPRDFEPGRVGRAVPGLEMRAAENGEILVRGPNVFSGYWQRPGETDNVLVDGWFHTGDLGEADASGNWRITGRLKNLIILNSGLNVAPEPLEQALAAALPEAQHVMLVGNQRSFLSAIVSSSNGLAPARVQAALDVLNPKLPHYQRIHGFHISPGPFTAESGLLTTMGKIRRDAVLACFAAEIEQMYRRKPS